jgi:mono/diheme cytochrome c family protein
MTGQSEFDLPVQDPTLVAEGETLYLASCAACHGADLRGTPVGPSHLSVIYQPGHHTDDGFRLAAFSGVRAHHWNFGDMPPVAGVTEDDMDRIIAFIREKQRTEGFEAYPPR